MQISFQPSSGLLLYLEHTPHPMLLSTGFKAFSSQSLPGSLAPYPTLFHPLTKLHSPWQQFSSYSCSGDSSLHQVICLTVHSAQVTLACLPPIFAWLLPYHCSSAVNSNELSSSFTLLKGAPTSWPFLWHHSILV